MSTKKPSGGAPLRKERAEPVIEKLLPEMRRALTAVESKKETPEHARCRELIRKRLQTG